MSGEFNATGTVQTLLRQARSAALATLMPSGGDPYCSLVTMATATDGSPLLLISELAIHTRNLEADARASLMIATHREDDPLRNARVTLSGAFDKASTPDVARRFLACHPEAAQVAGFKDFAYYRMKLARAHLVAGFGRIVDLNAADILTDTSDAEALLAAEAEICAHMNADHADAMQFYATKLLGAPGGMWQCVGCDPDGMDLQAGYSVLRLRFPERVTTPGQLRGVLKQMAARARV